MKIGSLVRVIWYDDYLYMDDRGYLTALVVRMDPIEDSEFVNVHYYRRGRVYTDVNYNDPSLDSFIV